MWKETIFQNSFKVYTVFGDHGYRYSPWNKNSGTVASLSEVGGETEPPLKLGPVSVRCGDALKCQ